MADMQPGETVLTEPQRRALTVLAAAISRDEPRPVRVSQYTTPAILLNHHEMLTVHWKIADQLVDAGYVVVTNDVLRTLELTPEGRTLAREAGLA